MKFDSNINQKMINFRPDMAEYPSQEQLLIFIIFSTNTHQSHMFSPRLAIFPETGNALADDITTRSVAATVKYVQACRAAYNMAMPTRFPLQLVLLQTVHNPLTPATSTTNHPGAECARLSPTLNSVGGTRPGDRVSFREMLRRISRRFTNKRRI